MNDHDLDEIAKLVRDVYASELGLDVVSSPMALARSTSALIEEVRRLNYGCGCRYDARLFDSSTSEMATLEKRCGYHTDLEQQLAESSETIKRLVNEVLDVDVADWKEAVAELASLVGVYGAMSGDTPETALIAATCRASLGQLPAPVRAWLDQKKK